jgi:NADH:ubiquinone oxidoreductase subunit F (NADH-binding)
MLSEAKTEYVSNIEICIAEGKISNDRVMSVLENNLGVHHCVYQDNFYNSVNLVGILSKCTVTGCGTVGPKRGILKDLEKVIKQLKRGQSFHRKVDVFTQVWKDIKRLV